MELLDTLKHRFETHMHRHKGVAWAKALARLEGHPGALEVLRARGGALFCDRRYGQVFTYHNGVQPYYAARGFRGSFKV